MKRLKLPKNKFARLGIYIFIIVFWTFLKAFLYNILFYFTVKMFFTGDYQFAQLITALGIIFLVIYIVGLIVFTKKIWFPKRPRIKRLKD